MKGPIKFNTKEYKQTSQPQNTENLETDAKKSGDFSKNQSRQNQVNGGSNLEKVFFLIVIFFCERLVMMT